MEDEGLRIEDRGYAGADWGLRLKDHCWVYAADAEVGSGGGAQANDEDERDAAE